MAGLPDRWRFKPQKRLKSTESVRIFPAESKLRAAAPRRKGQAIISIGDARHEKAMLAFLVLQGLKKGAEYVSDIVQGALHNETAWQQRVPNMLQFLYAPK